MKKQQILEKSHDIFYKNGFNACGVELLAREAGTTKRTLYAHFGNKEGLITATLNYRHQWFMAQLQQYLDNVPSKSLVEAYLSFLQGWIRSDDFYGCMFINACSEFSDISAAPHQIAKSHKKAVREYLQKRLNNDTVAALLFIYGEGLIVSSQAQGKLAEADNDSFIDFLNNY